MRILITAFVVLFFSSAAEANVAVPPMATPVVDLTATLKDHEIDPLEHTIRDFEIRTGSWIEVLLLPTTSPETYRAVFSASP
jgi:uncharacterized protein